MLQSSGLRTSLAVLSFLLFATVTFAQSTTVRVVRSAVVVAEPSGDASVEGTVAVGELLEVLDERGSWHLVRPPDDGTTREWRTGWVNKGMVELLVRGVTPAPDPAPSRSAPAQARARRSIQNRYPSTETAVAWSVVKDFALSEASDVSMFLGGPSVNDTSALGFNVATTANFNHWFGLTTEGGGSFFSQDVLGIEIFDIRVWTIMSGPKFTLRKSERVAPFGQVLLGAAFLNGNVLGESGNEWDFALQPGGGVDVALSDAVALRFGVDVRVLFDKPFSVDSHNQLRFTTGVVFRTW